MTIWKDYTLRNLVHIVPLNDLQTHLDKNCPCGATANDGIVIHNSFDEREQYEQGIKKLN